MRYLFEDCELDTGAFELRRAGEPVNLEPQVFDVLVHLVRHRDRLVTKAELLDEVWGDLADRIPGARFVELEGSDHFVAVDPDQILDPVEDFVRGLGSSEPTELSLTTLLAVRVEENLDIAWVRSLLREVLEAQRGVPAVAAGTAVLATFDGPGRAVRCALALLDKAAASNLHLAAGLHTAEIARRGAEVSGEGVTVAKAVADRAPAGEVWVTATLRDLIPGSGLSFEPRDQLDVPSLGRRLQVDAAR
jgi:hypothetical protein